MAKQRRSFSPRVVFSALLVSLVLALGVAGYIFVRYVRYQPMAHRHLPENTAVAVRLNVEQAVVYEPFREHILPLLEIHREEAEPRAKHLERETTIELGVDLREVIFARARSAEHGQDRPKEENGQSGTGGEAAPGSRGLGNDGDWLIALGGHFRRDGVVEGISRMLAAEGVETEVHKAPLRLVHPSGAAFGVAEDGVLLVAGSEGMLMRAFPGREQQLSFQRDAALELIAASVPHECCPAEVLGGHVQILSGQNFPVKVRLQVPEDGWSDPQAPRLLSGRMRDFMLLGDGVELSVDSTSSKIMEASGTLDRKQFDATVKRLGASVRRWME